MENDDGKLMFLDEALNKNSAIYKAPWKLLIVDDDRGVHDVTHLALAGFECDNRGLEFISAYSGEEGRAKLIEHPDIAVALVDVVMEHEHSGLDLVKHIRDEMKNKMLRIILRTGQPGQAPERSVIKIYDINDYKEKSELSAQKLYSTVLTSLRSYRDLLALDANRAGLNRVIHATAEMFQKRELQRFVQGVLEQLVAVLFLDKDTLFMNCNSIALQKDPSTLRVVAATGSFSSLVGETIFSSLPKNVMDGINYVLKEKKPLITNDEYWGYFGAKGGKENVVYLKTGQLLSEDDADMIQLFLQNVGIAYENTLLHEEIEGTQKDIVYMLGEAIETRSKETGQHVRRVAEYCYLIALGIGLTEQQAETLKIAAPLHDFGKIGIPDAILHKKGNLDDSEWKIMRTHAEIGRELLCKSNREILQAASVLAGQHHEKWDGTGYPNGLKGEEIHIYGRIGAVADVYDALGTRRSYKEPWPLERILDHLVNERGKHLDPVIVDWVLNNVESMQRVADKFPDVRV